LVISPTGGSALQPGAPERKLRLPLPGGKPSASVAADLNAPQPGISLPPPPAVLLRSEPEPADAPQARSFSSADLLEKLSDDGDKKKKQGGGWRDYKDVIRTGVLGALILGGIIGYRVYSSSKETPPPAKIPLDMGLHGPNAAKGAGPTAPAPSSNGAPGAGPTGPETTNPGAPNPNALGTDPQTQQATQQATQQGTPSPPAPATPQNTQSTQNAQNAQNAPEVEHKRVIKAQIPMVSIVSDPVGAMVEIDGTVYGKTPLIMPCPHNVDRMHVRLKSNKYQTWDQQLTPSEAGHFSVNAVLKPLR
jgi:hypothetical protein